VVDAVGHAIPPSMGHGRAVEAPLTGTGPVVTADQLRARTITGGIRQGRALSGFRQLSRARVGRADNRRKSQA
jgi:hypothetical protein